MRRVLAALLFLALAGPALAQPTLQNRRDVTGVGPVTVAGHWVVSFPHPGALHIVRAGDGSLTGTLDGKPCVGAADGARFTLSCQWQPGTMAVFIGWVSRQAPTLTTLRDRRAALGPEILEGTVYLPRGGDPIEPGRSGHFTAARS